MIQLLAVQQPLYEWEKERSMATTIWKDKPASILTWSDTEIVGGCVWNYLEYKNERGVIKRFRSYAKYPNGWFRLAKKVWHPCTYFENLKLSRIHLRVTVG